MKQHTPNRSGQKFSKVAARAAWVTLGVVLGGYVFTPGLDAHRADANPPGKESGAMHGTYTKPSDGELRKKLSNLQYEVTQHDATEPPFRNEFWNNHEAGLYVDVATGEPLFSSRDKFDSGTGWPSFTKPVEDGRVVEKRDSSHGMLRVEVRSRVGNSHLGHLFDDGPKPTGMRYCINSAALRFVPASELEAAGYGQYRPLVTGEKAVSAAEEKAAQKNACATPKPGEKPGAACETTFETVVLAGGCFWGMEDILRAIPGVIDTAVGYAGGSASVTYEDVRSGSTGNAEAVRVTFDPKKISFAALLENWFFRMHDPTTKNRQGNDVGTQYRSAIFYESPEQKKVAEEIKAKVDKSGVWKKPIVTEIVAEGNFTPAEDYHQDYLQKHPGGYTCHYMREF